MITRGPWEAFGKNETMVRTQDRTDIVANFAVQLDMDLEEQQANARAGTQVPEMIRLLERLKEGVHRTQLTREADRILAKVRGDDDDETAES